jgi:hypothetical protein
MVDLGRQEDWSDYMLIEWAAALELHQRGRVKAVLPLLVGETDFWSEAHAAFGGVQALPTQTSAATVEKVVHGRGRRGPLPRSRPARPRRAAVELGFKLLCRASRPVGQHKARASALEC